MQALPQTIEIITRDLGKLHHGVQVYVSLAGEVVADYAIGENQPGQPLTTDTLMLWMSAGKPVTAAAIMLAWQAGRLSLDDPVAESLPEFVGPGKNAVTLRHLLTHTAGVKEFATRWHGRDWQEIIAQVCAADLKENWPAGQRAGYQPQSTWFLLAEILTRLNNQPFPAQIESDIFRLAGMQNSFVAFTTEQQSQHQHNIGVMYERARGGGLQALDWHQTGLSTISPGGNLRGTARDLGRFYESLLGCRRTADGSCAAPLLNEPVLTAMTAAQRRGLHDETLGHIVDYGFGVIVNSAQYGIDTVPYGFGQHASPRTFGHGGSQSSMGFADPDRQLVVVWLANGRPGEPKHQQRNREINTAIYQDLALV